MENNEILKKVSSRYILKGIISYIYDIDVPFKLFNHSKYFQQALELNYFVYIERYFDKLGLNFLDFTYLDYSEFSDFFDKDILKKNLNKKLSELKIDVELINKFAMDYLKNYYLKNKENQEEFIIEIYSPFFDIISKSEFFEQVFTIPIPANEIKQFNLKNDYISLFEKMNKSNQKYSSLYFRLNKIEDLNYLKEFKVDFTKIKRLTIKYYKNEYEKKIYGGSLSHYLSETKTTNDFYKNLFLLEDIQNNLIDLNIDNSGGKIIELEYFNNLNNLKSLKELDLNNIKFSDTFFLSLESLEKINFKNCKNLAFAEDIYLKIKKFILYNCNIRKTSKLLKFPNLEECALQDEFHHSDQLYNEIIDFSSLNKLKILEVEKYDFMYFKDCHLKKIKLFSKNIFYGENEKDIEIKVMEKLISMDSLNEIDIILRKINHNDIAEIKGENHSVKEICINWKNKNDCLLLTLQEKFLKLNKLKVKLGDMKIDKMAYCKIKENRNCNTHEININCQGYGNIEFNVESLENLFNVNLSFDSYINSLEYLFPIFNDKCNVNFNLLTHFSFTYFPCLIDMNIINNIINNTDKIPNIKEFYFRVCCEGEEEIIEKLFKKMLSLNLNYAKIEIKFFTNDKEGETKHRKLLINKFNKYYFSQ